MDWFLYDNGLLHERVESKRSCKEKCDSNNNCKTAWPRMIFRVTSIFKIIIRVSMKNAEFCRKTSKSLLKRCLFFFCIFYLNEKELNQQVSLIVCVENEISNSTSQKKGKRGGAKNIIQLQKYF